MNKTLKTESERLKSTIRPRKSNQRNLGPMQIFEIIGECVCVGGRGVISRARRSRRGSERLVTVERKSMDRKNVRNVHY